jgi:hypothetical protein
VQLALFGTTAISALFPWFRKISIIPFSMCIANFQQKSVRWVFADGCFEENHQFNLAFQLPHLASEFF